jgi:Ca2+-binding RTX toxin-like protein
VLNLDDLKLSTGLDNVEGLTFGPKLADGRQSIVLVSDNNFSATQFTQVITLGAELVPTAVPTEGKLTPAQVLAQATNLVSGTTGADNLVAGVAGFDGINDIVFTGAGNDSVDVPIAGALAGNNRIDTGSGADTIFVGNGDRAFGSTGDDIFEASDAKDYRIAGGAGNDTLFLGANGSALGGDGADKLFVGSGGGNFLSGGGGADQFWITNAEIAASSNTIVDFQIGTDVIGIQGAKSLGISASTIKLTQVGTDTTVSFGTQTLAVLTGIQATSLTPANAGQFVFA